MDRKEWLEKRKKGIGGSDAPVVCGLSPWKTPYQLYHEKVSAPGHGTAQEETEPMRWGSLLEPVIRQRYADVTGRIVTVPNEILIHPAREWQIASLDGICPDRVLECKASRTDIGWGEPETNEVPEHYLVQAQHYLLVTGLALADVAVLFGGSDFRIYTVPADPDLQEAITEQETRFWERVQAQDPPDATSYADIKQKFGAVSKAVKVHTNETVQEALKVLREIKYLKDREEEVKAVIMAHMGEADTLVDGQKVLATWKLGKAGSRFDLDAFRNANPTLTALYTKPTNPARRFLVK